MCFFTKNIFLHKSTVLKLASLQKRLRIKPIICNHVLCKACKPAKERGEKTIQIKCVYLLHANTNCKSMYKLTREKKSLTFGLFSSPDSFNLF